MAKAMQAPPEIHPQPESPKEGQASQPTPRMVKVTEYLRYDFSTVELQEKSRDLALAIQSQRRSQEEMKAAVQQFKQQIEQDQAKIGALSNNVSMGWEMRNIPCQVEYHVPNSRYKRTIRTDTGEIVREQAMSAAEMQENLFADQPQTTQETAEAVQAFFDRELASLPGQDASL